MINVLLNYYNFDEPWARPLLQQYVVGKRVLIVPLAFRPTQAWDNDSWQSVYGTNGEKYQAITHPFVQYGYDLQQLEWLNPYDDKDHVKQIQNADLLFFTGGLPERIVQWLDKLGITQAVKNFDGVVMGASAGAMFQLQTYHITPDDDYDSYGVWQGLGLVDGLDLEVHYLATDIQKQCTQRATKQLGLPVYQMWHQGGLLVQNGKVTTMGQVEIVR